MTAFAGRYALVCPREEWAATRGRREATTARWRDKRPRGAASDGRDVSTGYAVFSRGASVSRASRLHGFRNVFSFLSRCAGAQS